jgi:hypothetical protein
MKESKKVMEWVPPSLIYFILAVIPTIYFLAYNVSRGVGSLHYKNIWKFTKVVN